MNVKKISKLSAGTGLAQPQLLLMEAQPLPPKVRQQCLELLAEMLKSVITLERKAAAHE